MSEPFSFELISSGLPSLATASAKECLLQWNLDSSILDVKSFRIFGPISRASTVREYENMIASFLESPAHRLNFEVAGEVTVPVSVRTAPLASTVTSMAFFERLKECDAILTPSGNIRGCFEEIFDGIIVNDCLREMLVSRLYTLPLFVSKYFFYPMLYCNYAISSSLSKLNPDSENGSLFSPKEKNELIFQLFRILCLGGGGLCQPDVHIPRYLNMTKAIYKDLMSICKNSKSGLVELTNIVFRVDGVAGCELFPKNPEHSCNTLIVVCDPIKRTFVVIKYSQNKYW